MECGIVESLFTIPWDLIDSRPPRRGSGSRSDLFAVRHSGAVVWTDVGKTSQIVRRAAAQRPATQIIPRNL